MGDDDEIASLERVLTRLTMTDDDRLEGVLNILLPRLLSRLGESVQVRNKTLEVLQHVNKRVRYNKTIKLPCMVLADMLHSSNGFTFNFSLVYLELGAARMLPGEKTRLAPRLVQGLAKWTKMQQDIVLRILTTILPSISVGGDMINWFSDDTTQEDKAIFKEFLLDWLLYAPPQQSTNARGTDITPPGLTPSRLVRLKSKDGTLPNGAELASLQVSILTLLLSGIFPHEQILAHLVVGRSGLRHDVVSTAEQGMARVVKTTDMNNSSLLLSLMSLVVPSIRAPGADPASRKLAVVSIRERALNLLLQAGRSGLLATIRESVTLFEDCIISPASSGPIRVLALQFGQTLLRSVDASQFRSRDLHHSIVLHISKQTEQLRMLQRGSVSLKEREQTYSCLGVVARVFPELFRTKVLLVGQLLELLEEEPDIRLAIQEALDSLCGAFTPPQSSAAVRETIKSMLAPYVTSSQPRARLVAADWSRRLFAFRDCASRFICLTTSCDEDLAARQVAVRGLLPGLCATPGDPAGDVEMEDDPTDGAKSSKQKSAAEVLRVLEEATRVDSGRLAMAWADPVHFPDEHAMLCRPEDADQFPSFEAWMDFLRQQLDYCIAQAQNLKNGQVRFAALLGFAFACLQQNKRTDKGPKVAARDLRTLSGAVEAALEIKDTTQLRVLHRVATRCLLCLVDEGSAVFPVKAAWLLKWLEADSPVVRETIADLVQYCPETRDNEFVATLLERAKRKVVSAVQSRHGAILAIGRMLHYELVGSRPLSEDARKSLSSIIVATLVEKSKFRVVTIACIQAIGLAAKAQMLLASDEELESIVSTFETVTRFDGTLTGNVEQDNNNVAILTCTLNALGPLCAFLQNETLKQRALDSLFKAGSHKEVELQITVARSLSYLAGKSGSDKDALIKKVMHEAVTSTKNKVRAASAFWLLELIVKHGKDSQTLLEPAHATFAALLRERTEITRECAARGMSWVYRLANTQVRAELVSSLARHLAAKTVHRQTPADAEGNEDPEGAEPPTISSEVSGSAEASLEAELAKAKADANAKAKAILQAPLNTVYKEVFAVATRVRRPALTYRLLYLSAGDALWKTFVARQYVCGQYEERDEELSGAVIDELVPILFRFRFDADPAVRDTMTKLWGTITEPMGSETEIMLGAFEEIMEEVLKNIASTKVRERLGGANALRTMIREAPDHQVLAYLSEIWKLSLRLVDDLNEATKLAALLLAKQISDVTVRLCTVPDASEVSTLDERKRQIAFESLNIALPFLLERGLADQSKEGQAIAIHTLARVVKVCKENIRPKVTEVITRILENMSLMEDQNLQYAMFHTSDQGGDLNFSRDELESARVQATSSSPLQQGVDTCVDQIAPGDNLDELAPQLARLARSGVGLPTLAATARTISRLAARRDLEEGLRTHAVILLRGLAATLKDRSAVVRNSFGAAAAGVARVAEPTSVKEYVKTLAKLYEDPGDVRARMTSGSALRGLLQRAPVLFTVLAKYVVPLVLLARHDDEDEDVSEIFREIWTENAGTLQNGIQPHLELVVATCCDILQVSTKWHRRWQAAQTLRDISQAVAQSDLKPFASGMLDSLKNALPGRTWHGKEALLVAIADVWVKVPKDDLPEAQRTAESVSMSVLLPELMRETVSPAYQRAALDAVRTVLLFGGAPKQPDELLLQLMEVAGEVKDKEVLAKCFEAAGICWAPSAGAPAVRKLLDTSEASLTGSDVVLAIGVMHGLASVAESIRSDYQRLYDLAWRCATENVNPKAIAAALETLSKLLGRGTASPEILTLHADAQQRLRPYLRHRDPAVVHAATLVQRALDDAP